MTKLLHPKVLGLFLMLLIATQFNYAQQEVIHCWDFNGTSSFTSPLDTDNRVTGDGTITHDLTTTSFGGSTINACSGSGAGSSFSLLRGTSGAGTLNTGKSIDFRFSSEGYEDLVFSFWSRRTPTGFDNNTIQYSTDGGTSFTNLPSGNYNPISNSTGQLYSFNISNSVSALSDEPNLVLRITFDYNDPSTGSQTGNNRIDNVKLEGTPVNNNDDDSRVISPLTQIASKNIVAADVTTSAQAESIFSFDSEDLGTSDVLPTNITLLRFTEGPSNTANWSNTINDLILKDDTDTEITGSFSINGGEITFEPDTPISVSDGTSENFTIEAFLNTTGIVDGSVIQLLVSEFDAEFEADANGSQFANPFPADVLGNEITIDVVATDIAFLQQPTDVELLATMEPDVEVEFVDANGNRDTDASGQVQISSTGDLTGDPVSVNAIDGVATFSSLVHTTTGENLALTATSPDPFIVSSDFFDVISNDQTSEVVTPSTQVASNTIIAANTTTLAQAEPVFNFDISDLGSGDGLPTEVTQMRFVPGDNNTANWSSTLQQVIVKDDTGLEIPGTYTITDTEILFTPEDFVSIADNTSESFSIDIILNATDIIDQSVIEFQVNGANNLGFTADFTGSQFNPNFTGGDVVGNEITIDAVATELAFLQQPTDVEVNAFIAPAVQVAYVDSNGNVDSSITTDIDLTSSGGTLVSALTPVPASGGVATFPNIAYSAEATGLTLTADTAEPTITPSSIISSSFDVGIPVIAIQDFDGSEPEWSFTTSVPTFDNGWDDDGFFGVINSADASPLANGSFVDNIFGENDLDDEGDNGTSGFASLDFVPVDVSGYTDVELSFDWEVIGYNASSDKIEYEVFFDRVSQGRQTLFEGGIEDTNGDPIEDASDVFNLSIPDTVSEVSFIYFIENNGSDGFSGLDNVKLTGNSNARDTDIIEPIAGQVSAGTLIADTNDDLANAVEVFGFEIVDSGNFDNLPTNVTRLRFVPGSNNTADWATVLQGISISDGTDVLDQANQSLTITSDEILVDITADPDDLFVVNDATSRDYTLSVFLNTTGIIDQEVIQLAIAEGNENQLASSDGSIFSQDISAFDGNEFTIDVVGNGLEFIVQPTTTALNANMEPDVEVANTDANGNFDLDNVNELVSITSTGTLSTDPNVAVIGANGVASFGEINHTQPGFGLELTATSGSFSAITSDLFDITAQRTLLISEVVDPSDDEDGRYVELFNMDVEPLDLSTLNHYLHNETAGSSVQLTGTIPAKSYYVISFVDAATFNTIYGFDPDFVASSTLASDGQDVFYLSFEDTEQSLLDVYGNLTESGTTPTDWEFTDTRAYRNIPTVRVSNANYTDSEWILEASASTSEATPGLGDNDFVYSGDWTTSGLGDPEGGSFLGSNADKSIFIESDTVTLSIANTISDVVVRDGAELIIEDAITLNGDFANFTTPGNGKVVFRSTATKTGVLGEFDAQDRSLVGTNYEVQRFIPQSNRAFRYLSSSVISNSTIRDNWQEGVNNTQTGDNNNIDPNPGFGMHITGSKTGANGFDATGSGNVSMFEWNPGLQQWDEIGNTNTTNLAPGKAYAALVRGDRSTTLNSNTAVGPSTTLRTTGRLVVGPRGVNEVSGTNQDFNLIGNPYQAKVDMSTLLSSGNSSGVSSQFVYIYDPTLGERGAYATVDLSDGTNTTTVPASSGADEILEPNQAFFVETVSSGANPAVVFRESYKTTESNNNTTFSVPEETTDLSINLFFDELDAKAVDGVKVKFRPGANNAKDSLDATKVWNYNESVAINRNPSYMSIETRALPTEQDSIPLYFGTARKLNYRWEINPTQLTTADAYLWDKYLETAVDLPTDEVTSYSFEFDVSIPASYATDRFVVRFENVTLGDDDFELDTSIAVYPNPISGERFTISQQAFEGDSLDLKLFDLQGRMVMNKQINNATRVEVKLDDTISSGVYILKLSDANSSESIKLIVE